MEAAFQRRLFFQQLQQIARAACLQQIRWIAQFDIYVKFREK
jgi:hypothetical protein